MIAREQTSSESNIWQRVIRLEDQISPIAARSLLKVRFDERDAKRIAELASKARAGQLDLSEQREADAYEQLGCLLDCLHSQARRALKRRQAS